MPIAPTLDVFGDVMGVLHNRKIPEKNDAGEWLTPAQRIDGRIAELEALLSEAHNALGEYSEGRFVSDVDALRRRIRAALEPESEPQDWAMEGRPDHEERHVVPIRIEGDPEEIWDDMLKAADEYNKDSPKPDQK